MAVLAHSDAAEISGRLAALAVPEHQDLREGENGLVMLRGRIGGDGAPFNLGEATVSRAAVRLATGEIGFGYTLGRDGAKARMIALCDAMVQSEQFADAVEARGYRAVARRLWSRSGTGRLRKPPRRGSISTPWCAGRAEMTTIAELPAGFADKVLSAQSTFRSVMSAMARPGSVQPIAVSVGAPDGMMRGTAAIALTLFDHDTPIWLDGAMAARSEVARWLKFHTSAPVVSDASIASFALIGDAKNLPALDRFAFGSNEYPDRSTTLILQVESLSQGPAYRAPWPRHRRRRRRCGRPSSRAICSSG